MANMSTAWGEMKFQILKGNKSRNVTKSHYDTFLQVLDDHCDMYYGFDCFETFPNVRKGWGRCNIDGRGRWTFGSTLESILLNKDKFYLIFRELNISTGRISIEVKFDDMELGCDFVTRGESISVTWNMVDNEFIDEDPLDVYVNGYSYESVLEAMKDLKKGGIFEYMKLEDVQSMLVQEVVLNFQRSVKDKRRPISRILVDTYERASYVIGKNFFIYLDIKEKEKGVKELYCKTNKTPRKLILSSTWINGEGSGEEKSLEDIYDRITYNLKELIDEHLSGPVDLYGLAIEVVFKDNDDHYNTYYIYDRGVKKYTHFGVRNIIDLISLVDTEKRFEK